MPAAHRSMAKPMGTLWPSNKVFFPYFVMVYQGFVNHCTTMIGGDHLWRLPETSIQLFFVTRFLDMSGLLDLWSVFVPVFPGVLLVSFYDQPMPGVLTPWDPRCGHRSWEATLYDRRWERRRPNSRPGQWASWEMTRSLGLCGIHLP